MVEEMEARAIHLREMRDDDMARVLQVEQMSYSIPWSEVTFRGLLKRRDAELIVALLDENVIGHAIYWHVLDQGELGNVAVAPDVRGLGAGALLVGEIITRAAARGVHELFLEVRPSNVNARHLYAKFGFVQVGRRKNYYQQPIEDALVLRLET